MNHYFEQPRHLREQWEREALADEMARLRKNTRAAEAARMQREAYAEAGQQAARDRSSMLAWCAITALFIAALLYWYLAPTAILIGAIAAVVLGIWLLVEIARAIDEWRHPAPARAPLPPAEDGMLASTISERPAPKADWFGLWLLLAFLGSIASAAVLPRWMAAALVVGVVVCALVVTLRGSAITYASWRANLGSSKR